MTTVEDLEAAFHRLDPGFLALSDQCEPSARTHLLRALAARPFRLPLDPLAEVRAGRLVSDASERPLLGLAEVLFAGGPHVATRAALSYARETALDPTALLLVVMTLTLGGVPGALDALPALVEDQRSRSGGDWRYDQVLAMVRQEQRRYDEARELALGALGQEPRSGHAVHVLTHVHYETGEHEAGLSWLDAWQREHRVAQYEQHLAWHGALHCLGLGDVEAALTRYARRIGPGELVDAGSLLWRCGLAGEPVVERGREAATAAQPAVAGLPVAFQVFNACFALAAAGDVDALDALAGRLGADPRPAYADLVGPVARALSAVLSERPADAVDDLDRVLPDLARVGGSTAQREVVEDTLVVALVRSGRLDRARALLGSRLERREHALDRRALAGLPAQRRPAPALPVASDT